MMKERQYPLVLLLGCVCLAMGGCQWALTVQPGDMMVEPGNPVEVKVLAERSVNVHGPNGVAVESFKPGAPVRLRFATGETWMKPAIRKIDAYHYVYTFRGTISESTQYTLDPDAKVVRSVGKGAGPYDVAVPIATIAPSPLQEGRRLGRDHIVGTVPTYRLVIALRDTRLSTMDREVFLKGFLSAYQDANDVAEGRKYTDVLRDAVLGSMFEQGRQDGVRHARNQISDSFVQMLITNAGGSGATALAWKAGYIDGFAGVLSSKNAAVAHDDALNQAETMYNSLKRGLGL
jgi:hypothetical protein